MVENLVPSIGSPFWRTNRAGAADTVAARDGNENPSLLKGTRYREAWIDQRQKRLLLLGLDLDKPHRRTRHRLADGLCIGGIGLAAFT